MSEPYLTTRQMIERIEADMTAMRGDIHKIQLDMAATTATVVSEAADTVSGRARAAVWAAAGSFAAAVGAVIVAIVKH